MTSSPARPARAGRAGAVLVVTVHDDVYVPDLVVAAVAARGKDAVRVDIDDFPGPGLGLVADDRGGFAFVAGDRVVDVDAVYCRRRYVGLRTPVEPRYAAGAARQGHALVHAWLRALGPRAVNAIDAEDRAEDKLLQLRTARALGFAVPPTLVSNDPVAVRRFLDREHRAGARVVTKLLQPLAQSMGAHPDFFYTADVDEDVARYVDDVAYAPQIFQRKLDKALELRVQVVGDRVFCGALVARARDWRLQQEGAFVPHTLKSADTDLCRALCRTLGLVAGAVDLVVDVDGGVWFLEVNPAGEWGFLQRDCGFDIAGAFADVLVHAAADADPGLS